MRSIIALSLMVSYVLLTGCVSQPVDVSRFSPNPKLSKNIASGFEQSKRILLLEPDVIVRELGVGTQEVVPEWTETAKSLIEAQVQKALDSNQKINIITELDLTQQQQARVNEHIALFKVISESTLLHHRLPNWQYKFDSPDDTIGSGLAFLKEAADIDGIFIIHGEDYQSSPGRQGAMVAGVLLGAFTGVAVVPSGGVANLNMGIVEAQSGDLLWSAYHVSSSTNLNNQRHVSRVVSCMFRSLPSTESSIAAAVETKQDKKKNKKNRTKRRARC